MVIRLAVHVIPKIFVGTQVIILKAKCLALLRMTRASFCVLDRQWLYAAQAIGLINRH